jgi:hypothetical protein
MAENRLMGLLGLGRDFAQGASNSIASGVSAPVDGLAWLMRKAGVDVGEPFLGSDWMARQGLTAQPQNKIAGLLGDVAGGIGPAFLAAKAPQVAKGLLSLDDKAMDIARKGIENRMVSGGMLQPATVWHGSPHKFAPTKNNPLGEFDFSKVGTGEGNQAYGHGGYLGGAKSTGEFYRDAVSNAKGIPTKIDGGGVSVEIPQWLGERIKADGIDSAISEWTKRAAEARADMATSSQPWLKESNAIRFEEQLRGLHAIKQSGGGSVAQPGYLYKVDLPDEHIAKMLDWDKPLSADAPKEVKDAFNSVIAKYPELKDKFYQAFRDKQPGSHYYSLLNDYAKTGDLVKNQSFASDALKGVGIPGIRYLDGGSRGAGAGSSNYVVFPGNEGILNILERNGESVNKLLKK